MAIPKPLILDDAGLQLGIGEPVTWEELACVLNHIELSPDTAVTTLDTMCGSVDYPGTTKWSLVATLYQSFDPDATEEILSAAVAQGQLPFRITPYKSQPVSATNPMWEGEVLANPYAPVNGDAGEASTIELEWGVIGEPAKTIVPPTMLAAAEGYAAMSLTELQNEAGGRGLPTSGTKAELAERLTADDASA
jgi:SAP domain